MICNLKKNAKERNNPAKNDTDFDRSMSSMLLLGDNFE